MVRFSRCLGESTDNLSVLLLREKRDRSPMCCSLSTLPTAVLALGILLRRFTDGDDVIATGNHVRILHLDIDGQKAFAGGIQSGGAL